jgi:CRISPR/Cas system CSM-associated protein Csm4 (group 5 of RAMP superfamily)
MPPYGVSATVVIEPRGVFRFGVHPASPGHVAPLPASDTLFGALLSAGALLGDDIRSLLAASADGDPPFLLSSAMPHIEGRAPFVPRPQRLRPVDAADEEPGEVERKQLKRVAYVELPLLAWYRGEEARFSIWGPLMLSGEHRLAGAPWEAGTIPGVTVDRLSGASALYHHAMVAYADGRPVATAPQRRGHPERLPHLRWAIHILARDGSVLSLLERWLHLLSLTGIGGRRSRGGGSFTFELRTPSLLPLSERPRGLSLSWVAPRGDETEQGLFHSDPDFGYRADERFGWIASPWRGSERSRRLLMLAEGSYLNPELPAPVGSLVDVTPDSGREPHPVYRWGFGLFLDESEAVRGGR